MRRLQTLWGLFCRHSGTLDGKDREARLGWVAGAIGRQIGSCNELTAAEAKTAIDAIQKHLPPELLRRKRPSRETARAYGTAGRKARSRLEACGTQIRMADAETWRLLEGLLARIGWTRERLDAFLRSSKSPVRSGMIRTLGEANRVIWVLKSMLRRAESATHNSPLTMTVAGTTAVSRTPASSEADAR